MEVSNGDRERVFDAFRQWGFLEADLDPLGFLQPVPHPDLQLEGEYAQEARQIYCGTVGAEFMHIADPACRRWIQEKLEGPQEAVDQQRALDLLIRAEFFELVLQQRYLGSKRFSLEGVTALIPLVDEILDGAGQHGAVELVMGMSHRGRLNAIAHIARRPAEEVFAGFEDVDPRSVLGGGDVKYHMGATGEYETRSGAKIHIHLVSNPSHLEAVDPVTVGRTRAKQDRAGEGGNEKFLPLLVHGDGAFAGQGVFAETLNLADIPAYSVGGTLHVIVNNLIGFTTVAQELHSSRFAAQLARRQSIPIFHVNAEDVDAVIAVAAAAGRRPQVAVRVATDAVRGPGTHVGEHAAVPGTTLDDVVHVDAPGLAGVDDVQPPERPQAPGRHQRRLLLGPQAREQLAGAGPRAGWQRGQGRGHCGAPGDRGGQRAGLALPLDGLDPGELVGRDAAQPPGP